MGLLYSSSVALFVFVALFAFVFFVVIVSVARVVRHWAVLNARFCRQKIGTVFYIYD